VGVVPTIRGRRLHLSCCILPAYLMLQIKTNSAVGANLKSILPSGTRTINPESPRMAEKRLYRNCIEPEFPFHIVAKKIGWLSEELLSASRSECPDNFVSLLNTVLVWSRARTATWLGIEVYSPINALVESLNTVLD
jgi:hypothetical protein